MFRPPKPPQPTIRVPHVRAAATAARRLIGGARGLRLLGAACAAASLALSLPDAAAALPVPQPPSPVPPPSFIGSPAIPHPAFSADPPRHPYMAPNGASNIHGDAYMSDVNQGAGPLGKGIETRTNFQVGECASLTFDHAGRLVSVCVSPQRPTLVMFDPKTLDVLASMPLPAKQPSLNLTPFNDFSGGGYFYLDNQDRAVIPTNDHHVYVAAERGGTQNPGFALARDYDLSSSIASSDKITSALPDWAGRIWFVSFNGIVGTIDPASGRVQTFDTREEIENSFAVDQTGGVYIVSDKAMYRFDADRSGAPAVSWREVYPNSGIHKPGQIDAGSGTTPTVMGTDYVSIADNADPMDIVVFKRARTVTGSRVVCVQPVFQQGTSADENSLIGTTRAMIAENNYGYSDPTATEGGKSTAQGVERVDINSDGRGCHVVWTSGERVPSVVSKLSLANGLIYSYTKDPDPNGTDAWYLTAIDFRTGQTVYKSLAGTGLGFNNNYAPVTLGPDGTAYVGVLGGLSSFSDATPPAPAAIPARRSRTRRLELVVRRLAHGRLLISIRGSSRRLLAGADVFLGRRKIAHLTGRIPFAEVRPAGLRHGHRYVFAARVRMRGRRPFRLTAGLRP